MTAPQAVKKLHPCLITCVGATIGRPPTYRCNAFSGTVFLQGKRARASNARPYKRFSAVPRRGQDPSLQSNIYGRLVGSGLDRSGQFCGCRNAPRDAHMRPLQSAGRFAGAALSLLFGSCVGRGGGRPPYRLPYSRCSFITASTSGGSTSGHCSRGIFPLRMSLDAQG